MVSPFWRRWLPKTRRTVTPARRTTRPRLEALEDRMLLAAGDLDPTFGVAGKLVFNGTNGLPLLRYNARNSLAVQSDGKIVVADVNNQANGFSVARFNINGTIDTSFGVNGFAVAPAGMLPTDKATAVAVQPDNKIVAVGTTSVGGGNNFVVVRYNPNGQVDTSFGFEKTGFVPIDFYNNVINSDDKPLAVVIQPNGRILVAGNLNRFFALARLNSDGLQDADFDADGKLAFNFGFQTGNPGPTDDQLNAIALQPDGEIIVAGSTDLTVRGTLPGKIDFVNAFTPVLITANNHQLRTGEHVFITGVQGVPEANGAFNVTVIDPDHFTLDGSSSVPQSTYALNTGRFIIGGDILTASNQTPIVITTAQGHGLVTGDTVRISGVVGNSGANGTFKITVINNTQFSLDNSFGTGAGTGGQYIKPFSTNFAVARIHALDGTLDANWANKGLAVTDFFATPSGSLNQGGDDTAFTAIVRNDGFVVVGGLTQQGDGGDNFGIAVYDRVGKLNTAYNLDGLVETDFSPNFTSGSLGKPFSTDQGYTMVLQPDGKTILGGVTTSEDGTNNFALARYNTDGSLDQTFGRHGLVITGFSAGGQDEIRDIALQPSGILVAGFTNPGSGPQFVLSRYQGFAAGSLQLNAPAYSVGDSYGSATFTVTRTNGTDGTVSVRFTTSDGTATAGVDYQSTSGQVTFAQGETAKTFTVPILNPAAATGPRNFNITLSGVMGGASLGTPSSALVTITHNKQPNQLQFQGATFTVNESDGFANIVVTRIGDPNTTVSVDYATSDGTGLAGRNYTPTTGTLTFGPGELTKVIPVGLVADQAPGVDTTFNVTLTNAQGNGATLGPITTTVVTVRETDIPGVFSFSAASYTAAEGSGPFTITVTRVGNQGTVTVSFTTSNGTATAGNQYDATSGTLTFLPGQSTRTFTVNIRQNNVVEGTKTVILTLFNPSIGTSLGNPSKATLSITDTTVAPSDAFVMQVYLDLLGRPVDPSGLSNWTGFLQLGGTRANMVKGITGSVEYRARIVQFYFQKYLGRPADPMGLNTFITFLGSGGTDEQFQAKLLGSPEYLTAHGLTTNDAFLGQLYVDVLNRPIDPMGLAIFRQALNSGQTREQVAFTLLSSDEYRRNLVNSYYQTYLHRPGDAAGINGFVQALKNGARDEDVIAAIVSSDEYFRAL